MVRSKVFFVYFGLGSYVCGPWLMLYAGLSLTMCEVFFFFKIKIKLNKKFSKGNFVMV